MRIKHAIAVSPSGAPQDALARLGPFIVRVAESEAEKSALYRLRYAVFCREGGAKGPGVDHLGKIESDAYDPFCDHLIVIDTRTREIRDRPVIAGACRLMAAPAPGLGFCAGAEFDVGPVLARHAHLRFCEVGRSCIAPAYRGLRTIDALLCGLYAYACRKGIDAYFGTASFTGTDPRAHAHALSWLAHHAPTHPQWAVEAREPGATPIDLLMPEATDAKIALRAMPPLIRAYLRLNAHISPEAFIDRQFGTIDVMVTTVLAAAPKAFRQRFERATGLALSLQQHRLES